MGIVWGDWKSVGKKSMNEFIEKVLSWRFYKTEITIYGTNGNLYTQYLFSSETFGRVSSTKSTRSLIGLKFVDNLFKEYYETNFKVKEFRIKNLNEKVWSFSWSY